MKDQTAWKDGGAWLKKMRQASAITRQELAEQIGAPAVGWVVEIEAGKRPVPVAFHRAYARTFGIGLAAFGARCVQYYGPAAPAIDAAA